MNLNQYVNESYIKLTQSQIDELFEDRDKNKNKIACSQLPLALATASKYSATSNYTVDELFSPALDGLNSAISKYNPNATASFTSYAKIAMQRAVWDFIKFKPWEIIGKMKSNYEKQDIPKTSVFSSLYNESIKDSFESRIEDSSSEYTDEQNETFLIELIRKSIKKEKHSTIVIETLGLGMKKPLMQIEQAKKYNTSHQRISQIYLSSIKKLQRNEAFKEALMKLQID